MAIEKLADIDGPDDQALWHDGAGVHAISGIDLALWDLKGKLLEQPVYSLLGGPHKDRIFCYATGNDVDWYKELGFRAFKLACPYGPRMDGTASARTRPLWRRHARRPVMTLSSCSTVGWPSMLSTRCALRRCCGPTA